MFLKVRRNDLYCIIKTAIGTPFSAVNSTESHKYTYDRNTLLSLNSAKCSLPPDVWQSIRSLNINSVKPTRKGTKGRLKNETTSNNVHQISTELTSENELDTSNIKDNVTPQRHFV